MAIIDSAEEFRIGRVVSRLFDALLANAVPFMALAALLSIPALLLGLYNIQNISQTMGMNPAGGFIAGGIGRFFETSVLTTLVNLVFTFLLQAALTQGTISWLNGDKSGFGQSLSVAVKNFLPLVAIALLTGLGVMLGFVLLVIPGIIVMLMWSVVVPVKVIEGTGITESFGRSRALTKDYRGRIFLLFLVYFLLDAALGLAVRPLLGLGMLPKATDIGSINATVILVGWILRVVLTSITSVGVTSIYYELRLVKEGIGAQQMAAAFD
jgi:hypothetical protein